jgi:hypothetical protein
MESRYAQTDLPLETGAMLLACTDGVTEARDASGLQYGQTRLPPFAVARKAAARENLGLPVLPGTEAAARREGRRMASGDTSSAADVRQLNLQLLRVLLRFPVLGSPLYLDEEERLVERLLPVLRELVEQRAWLRRRHEPDTLAKGVCFDLIFAWRGGAPLWFTRDYLWNLIRRHLEKEGKVRGGGYHWEQVPDNRGQDAGLAEEIGRALRLAEEFRADLGVEDRKLFDAWVKHAGRGSWKKAYALAAGRSPTWVTNHLERLRGRLRTRHHIADPDDFIDALQFYGPAEQDETPASRERQRPEVGVPPSGSRAEEDRLKAGFQQAEPLPPRVDLVEAFAGDAELLELLHVHGDRAALSEQQIRQKLFGTDRQGALEALMGRALDRYLDWAREVGRPRVTAWKFYRRLASGRVNVAGILGQPGAGWTDEERRQAERLADCARPGSAPVLPYDDLPAQLGLGRRLIDQLLLKLQIAAAGRDRRARHGPSRPLPGG